MFLIRTRSSVLTMNYLLENSILVLNIHKFTVNINHLGITTYSERKCHSLHK